LVLHPIVWKATLVIGVLISYILNRK
ncbi:uncharacterized protein METZ01_LOCUS347764, partial [marine metagenome]